MRYSTKVVGPVRDGDEGAKGVRTVVCRGAPEYFPERVKGAGQRVHCLDRSECGTSAVQVPHPEKHGRRL